MTTPAFRPCAVIPTFDNALTIGRVLAEVKRYLDAVILVDDGSGAAGQAVLEDIERTGQVVVIRRRRNGGKGAAVKTGFRAAQQAGYTHALQIDADGQHDTADIPHFLEVAAARPEAAVLGHPVFDSSTPRGRRAAHQFTNFWTRIETGGPAITDPQCGYRIYPVEAACAVEARGNRMDFDIEIAVRLVWADVPIVNLPTRVRYLHAGDGGVSHFRPFRDNVAISVMHTRLVLESLMWRLRRRRGRPR